jgi:hypothetical protein
LSKFNGQKLLLCKIFSKVLIFGPKIQFVKEWNNENFHQNPTNFPQSSHHNLNTPYTKIQTAAFFIVCQRNAKKE